MPFLFPQAKDCVVKSRSDWQASAHQDSFWNFLIQLSSHPSKRHHTEKELCTKWVCNYVCANIICIIAKCKNLSSIIWLAHQIHRTLICAYLQGRKLNTTRTQAEHTPCIMRRCFHCFAATSHDFDAYVVMCRHYLAQKIKKHCWCGYIIIAFSSDWNPLSVPVTLECV